MTSAQSLAEGAVLAVLGGGLGIVFAIWARHTLSVQLAGTPRGPGCDLGLNGRALGFSLAAATVTALLAGLPPSLRAGRVEPLDGLKARRGSGKDPPVLRVVSPSRGSCRKCWPMSAQLARRFRAL